MQFIWIGIGGALGSILRFLLQSRVQHGAAGVFPYGTLTVNLLGSAVIGILAGLFESTAVSQQLKLFLMVGILGGFTTFSSFSLENMQLFKSGHARLAVIYILTSNVIGITLALGGFFSARWALRFF